MTTKQLILLRHAKSDWHSGAVSDFDRPLNHRGVRSAKAIGRWICDQRLDIDLILCSSALRTRETAKWVIEAMPSYDDRLKFDDDLYLSSVEYLDQIVALSFQTASTCMIIGHNPGLEDLLCHYCVENEQLNQHKIMPTAAVAVIEFDTENYHQRRGNLRCLMHVSSIM